MRRRILPRLLAVGILVLTLAGCVRFQADLNVTHSSTVDGTIIVAILNSDDSEEGQATARASADEVATGLLGDLRNAPGVTVADYASDDDYVGYELQLSGVAFDAFSGTDPDSLHFAMEDGQIVFSGALDFTDQSTDMGGEEGETDDSNLTVSISFPGAVTEHNGELSGSTVSWRTTLDQRVEMSARSTIATGLTDLTPILLIGGVVLLLIVVAVVVVVLVLRGRKKGAAPAVPGAAPAAAAPALPVATPAPAPTVADAPVTDPSAPAAPAAPADGVPPKPKVTRTPKTPKEPPAPTA